MENKFDYQNMLNRIRDQKMTKNKNPDFSLTEIDAWNNAIDLCHEIVKNRRAKFESENGKLPIPKGSESLPTDDEITEFANSSTEPFTRRGDNMSMAQTWITLGAVWMRNKLKGNDH